MKKNILTVEDLLQYCEMNKLQSFSSSESGYKLAVKIPATFEIEHEADFNHRGMMKLKFKVFHTGLNRNGSFVSREAAEKARLTIANRPILAYIHQLDNGEWDFEAHEMEEVITEDGEREIHYIENQVGAFSSEPTFWEHDDENDKDFVCAYGYIPMDYTKAAEIIERKNGTKNSCELFIDKMSYNAKEKYLDLEEFYVNGSTLLGSRDDGTEIGEGMLGSRADIVDFKAEPQVFETNTELIKVLENLNETLSHFNINDNLGKEVKEVKKKELEQEEFEQEVFDLTDGENSENPEDPQEPDGEEGDTTEGDTTGSDTTDESPTEGETATEGSNDDPQPLSPAINDDDPDILKKIEYTIVTTDGAKREFSLGVSELLNAAYNLANYTYGEMDNEWYNVEVFEEEGYIEMYGMFTGKNYRQSYGYLEENLTFLGERTEIFRMYVTAEQKERLEQMQATYSEMSEKLRHYEEEPEKMGILNSEDYSKVFNTEEYTELLKQDAHFELSIDEVKAKADSILLDYAKHSNFSLLSEKENQVEFKQIPVIQKPQTKENRYGTLFSAKQS
jgi:hypothetical protein